jgi:hypothetical protein
MTMRQAHDTLDVSSLPDSALDARSPVWWGNLLLICIETTTMVLLIACYFYIRRNFWAISGAPAPTTIPVDAGAAAAQLGL